MFKALIQYRYLIFSMIKQEVRLKYKGSIFGVLWHLFSPLLMLCIYTICFSYIFQAKWGIENPDVQDNYPLILFVGLIIHSFFAEILSKSPNLILNYGYLIRKTFFPTEILAWVTIGCALFQVMMSTIILIFINFFFYHQFSWLTIIFPIILIPFGLFLTAICWLLSSLGAYIRDISQFSGIAITVFLFLSPVFFPLSFIPEPYRDLAMFNPLTLIIEESRNVLLWNTVPDFKKIIIYLFISLFFMKCSYLFMEKIKKGFRDVI